MRKFLFLTLFVLQISWAYDIKDFGGAPNREVIKKQYPKQGKYPSWYCFTVDFDRDLKQDSSSCFRTVEACQNTLKMIFKNSEWITSSCIQQHKAWVFTFSVKEDGGFSLEASSFRNRLDCIIFKKNIMKMENLSNFSKCIRWK